MRTVVITGAASGIGRALAERLRNEGDRVITVDLHDADVTVDLSTAEGRSALVEQVAELSGGTIDAVVANAGLIRPEPVTVAVNYFGAIATLEGLRPLLERSSAPRAVLTTSLAAVMDVYEDLVESCLAGDEEEALAIAEKYSGGENIGNNLYASTKAAEARWVRLNAPNPEWAGAGIALNAVGPGIVETPMVADSIADDASRASTAEFVPMPLNGFMAPEAPAALLRWLISEENTHVTGQVVFIDGGTDAIFRGASNLRKN